MAERKHTSKVIVAMMAVAVVLCLLAVGFADKISYALGGTGVTMEYESKLFDTDEVMEINIEMDEETWNEMLENALTEEYYVCDVTINGEKVSNVAIRPKGNTSLSSIAMDDTTDRYSLKLEFDHFVDGQTCYGLDKLILNNNFADATNMKEAIIYDMFQYLGADASLYNYAKVSVNGEYIGVYLALEAVEQSFMLRNFGTQDGELYKPDSMEMGGDSSKSSKSESDKSGFPGGDFEMPDMSEMPNMGDFNPGDFEPGDGSSDSDRPSFGGPGGFPGGQGFGKPGDDDSSRPEKPDGENFTPGEDFNPEDMENFNPGEGGFPGGGFGGFMGGGGANLNYTDDDLDSYETIWDGEITTTGKKDHERVVKALKNISEGNDIETYMDVDNILKYMAVHTFSVNMDSLSGSMAHNYYLYEYDGKLNIFPWDYNLSLGGMGMGGTDATETINDAIDTPFSSTNFFDALLENEEYLAKYHEYLQMLVDEYVNGGRFDEVYNRIRSQIDELVETDPTAFFTYDEYTEAADTLYKVIKLRAESIDGQLNGTIPSTDEGQREDSSSFVDASDIDLSVMGSMGGSFKETGHRQKR